MDQFSVFVPLKVLCVANKNFELKVFENYCSTLTMIYKNYLADLWQWLAHFNLLDSFSEPFSISNTVPLCISASKNYLPFHEVLNYLAKLSGQSQLSWVLLTCSSLLQGLNALVGDARTFDGRPEGDRSKTDSSIFDESSVSTLSCFGPLLVEVMELEFVWNQIKWN
jgi:hypothetical protein